MRNIALFATAAIVATAGVAFAADPQRLDFTGGFVIALEGPVGTSFPSTERGALAEPGWTFHAVVTTPMVTRAGPGEFSEPRARQWVLATPPPSAGLEDAYRGNPWDLAHAIADQTAEGAYKALADGFADSPLVAIEPDVITTAERAFRPEGAEVAQRCLPRCAPDFAGNGSVACEPPSPHWPSGPATGWHLLDAYSELAMARRRVAEKTGAAPKARVTIAHLDTGYDPGNAANPDFLDEAAALDFTTGDTPSAGAKDPCESTFGSFPGHGTGTLGLLAGSRVKLGDFDDILGGAPAARVVPYRISRSVIHLRPVKMAAAIEMAWASGADVISMSMGGLPSGALRDAVNNAYEHGTAMFTASGDFFKIPWTPLSTPSGVVYPARFSRVVAVVGATADGKSYAYAPSRLSPGDDEKKDWMLRGSVGPEWAMEEAVTAYAPNVPWVRPSRSRAGVFVDLDGAGTSAATPQAAAAAALWLQYHRDDTWLSERWRSWEKTEAVYRAILGSADKSGARPTYKLYNFGAGLLKANRALDHFEKSVAQRTRAAIGFDWIDLFLRISPQQTGLVEPAAAARNRMHGEMLHTELAQLVYLSRDLDEKAPAEMDDATPSRMEARRFFGAVLKDPNASEYLKNAIREAGY